MGLEDWWVSVKDLEDTETTCWPGDIVLIDTDWVRTIEVSSARHIFRCEETRPDVTTGSTLGLSDPRKAVIFYFDAELSSKTEDCLRCSSLQTIFHSMGDSYGGGCQIFLRRSRELHWFQLVRSYLGFKADSISRVQSLATWFCLVCLMNFVQLGQV